MRWWFPYNRIDCHFQLKINEPDITNTLYITRDLKFILKNKNYNNSY